MTIQERLADSRNYQTGRTQSVRFLVIHYTANKGDTAKNNADYFANGSHGASAHYFVDETSVWQSVQTADTAWHCGAQVYAHEECRNANSIGVEICMWDKNGNLRQGSIDHAVELCREIVKTYGITEDRVLRHYDVTWKKCPAPMVDDPELWAAFKEAIFVDETNTPSSWAKESWEKAVALGVFDGTDPRGPLTREQAAAVLDRLGLLEKG